MELPESLISSFRNIKNIIPKHFDHTNTLARKINLVIYLTQIPELKARNHMVKPPGISNYVCQLMINNDIEADDFRKIKTEWTEKIKRLELRLN
ncbi:hypothetical protein SAMN05216490_1567 [Mucilaginibacter mallensis]|uniref:Uncharacterized protein n=1 Tax=Mucilaginibacter mallensis TaxID=652787 RepID=A0A1H1U2X1_MUCMA|nr:hypothetical protein SAMN05216490_1567 [Mucilaginibacter mallensis]